ncbi:MAG: signal peptide peptidase SppA, partial [Candidatus Acidiferrales bacterium]
MAMRKGRFFLLLLLLLFVGLFLVGQLARRVPEKTVLVLSIDRAVEEEDWASLDARFWEGDVVVFRHILEALERARKDERIAGVSVEIKWVEMSFGKIQELRQKLQEFTASGKFCTVYMQEATNRSYYLASACPEIYLLPKSGVALTGLMGHTTFLRGSLEKLRVSPDFYRIGEYKNAPDVYTEKKYTAPHREVVTSLLTEWQKQIVEGIASGRKLEAARVEQLVREGPYLSQEAVEKGLVDKLFYYDQYRDLLKQKAGTAELHTLDWDSYRLRTGPSTGPKIAIVYATGTIIPGTSGYHPMAGRLLGADTVAGALRSAREDDSVKAIVLRVDSPGGVEYASEIIRREVILAKQKKPVVVSMSDVAASGGYWIAMSANKIVADPGTVTGSIGIYAGKMNIKGFYELLGMTKDYVALAPNSTFFYAFENFTPEQREILLRYLRDGYQDFIQGVSEGRGIPVEEVDRIGRGRVWLGGQAKDLKLVDELGGLEQAVVLAKKMAGIPSEDSVSFQV